MILLQVTYTYFSDRTNLPITEVECVLTLVIFPTEFKLDLNRARPNQRRKETNVNCTYRHRANPSM